MINKFDTFVLAVSILNCVVQVMMCLFILEIIIGTG